MDRTQSPAYGVLRASARRVLQLVESEIAQAGRRQRRDLRNDMLEHCGSRRVYLRAMCEFGRLGLHHGRDRYPKKHICALDEALRQIRSMREAVLIAARARTQRMQPVTLPPQTAASVSA